MQTRKSKEVVAESPATTTTKESKLGLVVPMLERSKPIKKTSGEDWVKKLYARNSTLFDEYRRLKQVVKTATREKAAAEQRLETLFGSAAGLLDVESAAEDTETEQEQE